MIEFPISGIETYWWLPLVVAFIISAFTSTAGISGAFLLLPFQVSILGFISPAVTPTNLLFNIVAIPSGVYRFYREKRMVWPLVWIIAGGTLPGLVLGVFIRVRYLPDPEIFKVFVGLVLLYLAIRLLTNVVTEKSKTDNNSIQNPIVEIGEFNSRRVIYRYKEKSYQAPTPILFGLSALVGMIGGVYGIGGGAILAPLLVTIFSLPVHTIAGAALCATFLSSTVGVLFYIVLAPLFASGPAVMPDWHLGLLFGIGGSAGMYIGARLQKHIKPRLIKLILGLIMILISGKYILNIFLD